MSNDPDCLVDVKTLKASGIENYNVTGKKLFFHLGKPQISFAFGYNQQAPTSLFHKLDRPIEQYLNGGMHIKAGVLMFKDRPILGLDSDDTAKAHFIGVTQLD